jgi:hypothetical protein
VDPAELTKSLRNGDDEAVDDLFDRFGPGLYDYCLTLSRGPDRAADAVYNAILTAVWRIGELADPRRIEAWLYALARNECLRLARRDVVPWPVGVATLLRWRRQYDLREVSALVRRHGFDHRGVAAVLGVPRWRARALVARSRALAPVGTSAAPAELRERVVADAVNPLRTSYRADLAGPYRRSGFPVPADQAPAVRRYALVTAAVIGIVAAATAFTVEFSAERDVVRVEEPSAEQPIELIVEPTTEAPSGSPSASATPSPSPTPTRASARPTPAKRPLASRSPPPLSSALRQPAPPQPYYPNAIAGAGGCVEVVSEYEVALRTCDGGTAQRWSRPGDGTIMAFGKCLNLSDGDTANGIRIDLWYCNESGYQQWRAGPNGSLVNTLTGKCFDGRRATTRLELWPCSGATYQRWTIPA